MKDTTNATFNSTFNPLDHLPPSELTAESNLLGLVLMAPTDLQKIADVLTAEKFYIEAHSLIYRAMVELSLQGRNPDLVQVEARLHHRNQLSRVGGASYLAELVEPIVHSLWKVDIVQVAQLIDSAWRRRQLIAIANDINKMAHDRTLPDDQLFAQAEELVLSLRRDQVSTGGEGGLFEQISLREIDKIQEARENKLVNSVSTKCLYDVDKAFGGFKESEFSVIAAASKIGKSHFGVFLAYVLAMQGHCVFYASYEMSESEVWSRIVACHTGIDSAKFRTPTDLDDSEIELIQQKLPEFIKMRLFIQPMHETGMSGFIRAYNQADHKFSTELGADYQGIKLTLVDYIQLMAGDGKAWEEVDRIGKQLKRFAGEKKTHVSALAQVDSAAIANRQNKVPQVDDLSYCKTLKNHVNQLAFLHRPAFWDENCQDENLMELWMRLHRSLPSGVARMSVDLARSRFFSRNTNGFSYL